MDDWVNINAISITMLSGEAKLELDEIIDQLGHRYKANILRQILEQAEHQYYHTLANIFLDASSLEHRQNFILKNRVKKFAKKYRETGNVVLNIAKLERACKEKLKEKTGKMYIWL